MYTHVGHMIFVLCSGQLSLLKEKLAAERKEEQSWRDELREISGMQLLKNSYHGAACIVISLILQSFPVMLIRSTLRISKREPSY